ncbi:type II secretion system protein J [Bdellovibrio sp. HCB2-146]|uniref:PulJ/GspJ family protein n=1 Tax=Bdellovibrio sp. HCB2-146 TaxID=3394362 RepID=UPI0039BD51BF
MSHIKNRAGMSLVEVLVVTGIMAIIGLAITSLVVSQQKETRALTDKLSSLDLQQLMISTLADGTVCTFQLTDPSEAPHRTLPVININNLAAVNITFNRILIRGAVGAPVLITRGEVVSGLSSQLKVRSITLGNLQGTNNFYTAEYLVDFDSTWSRPPKPIKVRTTLQMDPASPNTAKTIVGCKGAGPSGRQWVSMMGQRNLNAIYVNDTGQDIHVSVQVYSGASGERCSATLRVDGVTVDYNFVNDSDGAAMCNASGVVPAGSTYTASSSGAGGLYGWSELR